MGKKKKYVKSLEKATRKNICGACEYFRKNKKDENGYCTYYGEEENVKFHNYCDLFL
ncbi:MAG: hypothetical protein ACW98D_16870 [Promethearchaeota archaeon]|jgi:hypothetical protein